MTSRLRIGVLTGGGDAPGLNTYESTNFRILTVKFVNSSLRKFQNCSGTIGRPTSDARELGVDVGVVISIPG
jgi:hypothetical protein